MGKWGVVIHASVIVVICVDVGALMKRRLACKIVIIITLRWWDRTMKFTSVWSVSLMSRSSTLNVALLRPREPPRPSHPHPQALPPAAGLIHHQPRHRPLANSVGLPRPPGRDISGAIDVGEGRTSRRIRKLLGRSQPGARRGRILFTRQCITYSFVIPKTTKVVFSCITCSYVIPKTTKEE